MSAEKLDTQIRKGQIVRAALEVVAESGLNSLSIAAVAEKVGLVPSAIYRHFGGKDEILDASLDFIRASLATSVEFACKEAASSLEALQILLNRHIHMIQNNPALPRLVFSEDFLATRVERKGRLEEILRGYLDRVGDLVRQGQREGKIRPDVDPETVSMMFLGIVQPAAFFWHLSGGRFDLERHSENSWRFFREAIQGS